MKTKVFNYLLAFDIFQILGLAVLTFEIINYGIFSPSLVGGILNLIGYSFLIRIFVNLKEKAEGRIVIVATTIGIIGQILCNYFDLFILGHIFIAAGIFIGVYIFIRLMDTVIDYVNVNNMFYQITRLAYTAVLVISFYTTIITTFYSKEGLSIVISDISSFAQLAAYGLFLVFLIIAKIKHK